MQDEPSNRNGMKLALLAVLLCVAFASWFFATAAGPRLSLGRQVAVDESPSPPPPLQAPLPKLVPVDNDTESAVAEPPVQRDNFQLSWVNELESCATEEAAYEYIAKFRGTEQGSEAFEYLLRKEGMLNSCHNVLFRDLIDVECALSMDDDSLRMYLERTGCSYSRLVQLAKEDGYGRFATLWLRAIPMCMPPPVDAKLILTQLAGYESFESMMPHILKLLDDLPDSQEYQVAAHAVLHCPIDSLQAQPLVELLRLSDSQLSLRFALLGLGRLANESDSTLARTTLDGFASDRYFRFMALSSIEDIDLGALRIGIIKVADVLVTEDWVSRVDLLATHPDARARGISATILDGMYANTEDSAMRDRILFTLQRLANDPEEKEVARVARKILERHQVKAE